MSPWYRAGFELRTSSSVASESAPEIAPEMAARRAKYRLQAVVPAAACLLGEVHGREVGTDRDEQGPDEQ